MMRADVPNQAESGKSPNNAHDHARRAVVIGLAAMTYSAPTITRLDTARAAFPSQCPPPRATCRAAVEGVPKGGRDE